MAHLRLAGRPMALVLGPDDRVVLDPNVGHPVCRRAGGWLLPALLMCQAVSESAPFLHEARSAGRTPANAGKLVEVGEAVDIADLGHECPAALAPDPQEAAAGVGRIVPSAPRRMPAS